MDRDREATLIKELDNLNFLNKSALGWQIQSSSIHLLIRDGKIIFFHSYIKKEITLQKVFEMVTDDIKDGIIWNLDLFR